MGRSGKFNARGSKHGKKGRKMENFSQIPTTPTTARQKFTQKQGKSQKKSKKEQQQQLKKDQKSVSIPFRMSDRILLVGEGDFSFSGSLATNHGCRRILATCYDNEDTLDKKYPHAREHINKFIGQSRSDSSSSTSGGTKRKREEEDDDDDPAASENGVAGTNTAGTDPKSTHMEGYRSELPLPKALFSIDARKLGTSPGGGGKLVRNGFPRRQRATTVSKQQRKGDTKASSATRGDTASLRKGAKEIPDSGPWDVVCFNFPHVGGLSTDVNRQVRANQELLVSFFKACVPLLSAPPPPGEGMSEDEDEDEYGDRSSDIEDEPGHEKDGNGNAPSRVRTEPGQIVVTLFEGEPYTLWNIRDLARHAGLRVVTSFKFPWESYPAYSHARTLGEIESKSGGRGGWRGEDREARSYVFERNDHENLAPKSKRKRKDSDDSGSE